MYVCTGTIEYHTVFFYILFFFAETRFKKIYLCYSIEEESAVYISYFFFVV